MTDDSKTMRSEIEIKKLILDTAIKDDRIRTVLLNGSRANPNTPSDKFQDFDIVFIVRDYKSFISEHDWTNIFGKKVIFQMPDQMTIGEPANIGFSYLMLFTDGNRIDLTLFPVEKIETDFIIDSLTIVWLDKDKHFSNVTTSSDVDYHIQRPTENEFLDTCNEFWWVSTYVAKGLLRNEITYAKEMLETVVRPMFMKVVEWKIGSENNFSVSSGKAGKFINKYLSKTDYEKLLTTYSGYEIENNWQSLFTMIDLFGQFAMEVSTKMNFPYEITVQKNTIDYLNKVFDEK